MKNIVTFNTLINQTRYVAAGLLAATMLLSGCQPSDSLSSASQHNNDRNAVQDTDSDVSGNGNVNANANGNGDVNVKVSSDTDGCQNDTVMQAFTAKQSERQVKGCGTIIKALPDDNEGSRHQKILIELTGVSPKQTLLLVHNIDLAPRVAEVSRGTPISFYGEYVYNEKGGLVHWTHHDPAARHQGGWIESAGIRYE